MVLNGEKDAISWKWSRSGEYSIASAYEIQFLGAFPTFDDSVIWKAKTEPKYRFFAWLAMLKKAPTTDNLLMKN
jgi:hypothetical protein